MVRLDDFTRPMGEGEGAAWQIVSKGEGEGDAVRLSVAMLLTAVLLLLLLLMLLLLLSLLLLVLLLIVAVAAAEVGALVPGRGWLRRANSRPNSPEGTVWPTPWPQSGGRGWGATGWIFPEGGGVGDTSPLAEWRRGTGWWGRRGQR
jgi:uncharacterized protein (DUF58 family)